MPTPLPSPIVPSAGGLIDAYRTGNEDFLASKKRQLLQEAGGLAAAGNMKGAMGALYKGGEFGEARGISGEIRAQSAEGRAQASHLRELETFKLEKALKAQGILARVAGSIQTPQQFETAKARIKALGLDIGDVSFDDLPQLRQQALTVQEQMSNEVQQRKLDILQQKTQAKANAPAKLTEGQAASRNFLGMAEQAETVLRGTKEKPGLLGVEGAGEAPISRTDRWTYENLPASYRTKFLDKRGKQYFQAAMQFIRAKLRKESGATISPDEFEQDFEVYFPQDGDDAQTIRQKAAARQQVLEGLRITGGLNPNAPLAAPDQLNQGVQTGGNQIPDDPSQWTDEQLDQYLAQ